MYFKRLEIFGFKSFADKTVLNFEPGVTTVVGPNGCGKSNIFDSIRWVLGEQSVKELRGSSMGDVIFSGTDKRPSLGFAEVHLTFSNESRMLPVEEDEVTISRRLFRSGESEYLINKEVVRLKDVQELLMGTGIGAEAYSLVQQGKVDLVVSAKPEDRRMLFDEASGITKYKAKKREALNKLKDTENNLLRVNDIIIEVKRQIASIERQANKARKYKVEYEKLKSMEVKFAKHQIDSFSAKKNEIKESLGQLKQKESSLHAQLEEYTSKIASESQLFSEVEEKIQDVKGEDINLANQVDMDNRQIGFNQERIENANRSGARLNEQKSQLNERCRVEQQKIEELKAELSTLSVSIENSLRTLESKKRDLNTIADEIHHAKECIKNDELKIFELNSAQVKIKNDLTEIMKELQGCLARKRRLEIENAKVTDEKEEIDERLRGHLEEIESLITEITDLRSEQQKKQQSLDEQRATLTSVEQTINELDKKRLFLMSQKQFIEELRVQYQDMPDPVVEGKLLTTSGPDDEHSGIIGKVKSVTKAEPGKYGNHEELYEVICETKFIQLDPQQITEQIEALSSEIETHTLQKVQLQEDIRVVSESLSSLSKDIHAQEKSLSILEAQKKDIMEESNKLAGELELVQTEIKEVRESLEEARNKEAQMAKQLATNEQEVDWCRGNIKEKQELIASRAQQREDATVVIAQIETELESVKDKEKSLNDNIQIFGRNLDNNLGEMKRIDEELAEHEATKDRVAREIEELKVKIEGEKQRRESLVTVLAENQKQKTEISDRLSSMRSQTHSIEKQVNAIKEQVHDQEMKDQELLFNEKGIKDRLIQTYKIDFDEALRALEEAEAAEAAEAEAQAQKEHAETLELDEEQMNVDIEKLKKRCDSFGSVNLVAIEEFEELKERHEFLTKQHEDLLAAKDSLHQTINKINRTTRQMFMETFTKVGETFRIYFRMLFGGGEAQLVLTDPDNVLESGIEIIARPPGKKLQNISLLSGGEKTMTAIALIFGVFKVKPSPFCVLDEIDAALDESNVGRYGYLLKDFAKIAQFIVVTHNKKTMAIADVMYGITMQEKGISKIVSVKFGEGKTKTSQATEPVAVS